MILVNKITVTGIQFWIFSQNFGWIKVVIFKDFSCVVYLVNTCDLQWYLLGDTRFQWFQWHFMIAVGPLQWPMWEILGLCSETRSLGSCFDSSRSLSNWNILSNLTSSFQCWHNIGREVDSVDDSVDFAEGELDDDRVDIAVLFDN